MISSFSIAQDWFPGRWGPDSSRGYCVAIVLPFVFLTQLTHQWIWLLGGDNSKLRSFLHVPVEEQRKLPPRMGQCHIASPCCMRCQVTTWLTTGCKLVQLTQAVFQRAKFYTETSRQHHERQNEFPFNEGCCVETAWCTIYPLYGQTVCLRFHSLRCLFLLSLCDNTSLECCTHVS